MWRLHFCIGRWQHFGSWIAELRLKVIAQPVPWKVWESLIWIQPKNPCTTLQNSNSWPFCNPPSKGCNKNQTSKQGTQSNAPFPEVLAWQGQHWWRKPQNRISSLPALDIILLWIKIVNPLRNRQHLSPWVSASPLYLSKLNLDVSCKS